MSQMEMIKIENKKVEKHIKRRKNNTKKNKNKKVNKKSFKNIALLGLFELIFTVMTFPFILLYGPFDNAKKAYVGAAMGTMNHQYLATFFLSDEKIKEIIGGEEQTYDENTDVSSIQVPTSKDESIDVYEITDNPKFNGYYMVIKDPTRIKIGVTSKLEREGETTSQIAENNNAIAAINGGAFVDKTTVDWTGTGANPDGIVISDGKLIWNTVSEGVSEVTKTSFGITKKGVLVVGQYSYEELKAMDVQEALSFGPALIINGKIQKLVNDGGTAPRTAIGQRADGAIILLVIDGRKLGSIGATYEELQEVLHKLGAVNALNLDGGRSTTMYYDGEVINTPSNSMGERTLPTAILVK